MFTKKYFQLCLKKPKTVQNLCQQKPPPIFLPLSVLTEVGDLGRGLRFFFFFFVVERDGATLTAAAASVCWRNQLQHSSPVRQRKAQLIDRLSGIAPSL